MTEQKIIVTQTKKRISLHLLGALFMSGISLFAFFYDERLPVRIFSLVGALGFFLCFVFFVYATKQKELFIADHTGISDQSSAIALGFIPWSHVAHMHLCNINTQTFIAVWLQEEEVFLKRLNHFQKNAILANRKLGYAPVLITLNRSTTKPEELLPQLNHLLESYRTAQQF